MFKKTTCPVCGAQWNEGVYDKCPSCGWIVGTEAPKNETHNPESAKPRMNEPNRNAKDLFEVNPRAESIADSVAGIILVLGWIVGIVIILFSIFAVVEDGETMYIFLSFAGIVYILLSYILWAFVKMFVNMSRNLFNIKSALTHLTSNK